MAFQQTQVYSTKRINLHNKYYVGKKCDVGFSYTTKPCKTRVYHPDVGNVYNISQRQVLYAIFQESDEPQSSNPIRQYPNGSLQLAIYQSPTLQLHHSKT